MTQASYVKTQICHKALLCCTDEGENDESCLIERGYGIRDRMKDPAENRVRGSSHLIHVAQYVGEKTDGSI